MTTKSASRAQSVFVITMVLVAASPALRPAGAQSLADVARKEEERRKTAGEPQKVYTNKDLHAVPAGSPPAPAAPETPAAGGGKAADGAKDGEKAADKEPVKDKAYWGGKLKTLQSQLTQDQDMSEAVQTRINSLTADFASRDDPMQRAKIDADRRKALTDLDRLKKAVVDDQKAIATLLEDARKAGVPPGWLR